MRTNGTPTAIIPRIRRILSDLEPGATIDNVASIVAAGPAMRVDPVIALRAE